MTGDEATDRWIDDCVRRLVDAGYREVPVQLPRAPQARALRRADFRMSWFLTRLHTFVVLRASDTPTGVSLPEVVEYATDAARWARDAKGGLPVGLQTGVAVLSVTVAERVAPDGARQAALSPSLMFGAFPLPVVVDVAQHQGHTYGSRITWGKVYQQFLGQQQRLVLGDTPGPSMPRSLVTNVSVVLLQVVLLVLFVGLVLGLVLG